MGLREKLNENPRITTGVTAGIIVVVLGYLIISSMSGGGAQSASPRTKAFFTVDDGNSWFEDDAKKVPPFDHDGKPAYGAAVYRCGGKTFVNHMFRYTPEVKKKVEEFNANPTAAEPTTMDVLANAGQELKSPGQKEWVKLSDIAKAAAVMKPKCAGNADDLEVVMPGE